MSYEIVKAAIEFRNPPRIPIENLLDFNNSDVVGIGFEPQLWDWRNVGAGIEECIDIFGCVRRRRDRGIGQIFKGAIDNWDMMDDFKLPDVEKLKRQVEDDLKVLPKGKFVLGDIGQLMFKIFELRGFENALVDFSLYPEKIKDLAKRLTEFAVKRTEMYLEIGEIHCITIYDDWGTQDSMLISPHQWCELFFEEYKNLFDYAHKNNLYVYFHSCGAVGPIINDMIQAGADIINFDQPRLHGIKYLAKEYRGRITFCCPVDIQLTLPKCDKDLIKSEALELVKNLHKNGGFIAKIYHSWEKSQSAFDPAEYSLKVFEEINKSMVN